MKIRVSVISQLILLVLCSFSLIISCSKTEPETKLKIEITKPPVGGKIVFIVKTEFRGKLEFSEGSGLFQSSGSSEPIDATVEWWWENKAKTKNSLLKTENITFNSTTWADTSSNFVAVPFGNFLTDYYWMKIYWTDKDELETPQVLETEKVLCEGY